MVLWSNLNSWFQFDKYEFMIWIRYWKSRKIEYSLFMVLNSVVKLCSEICDMNLFIWIQDNHIIIAQISVMNSFTNWSFMYWCIWIRRWIMVSYKKHLEAAQYNQPEHWSAFQFSHGFNCAGRTRVLLRPLEARWVE